MDSLKSVAVVSVAELLLLGSFGPELTETAPEDSSHRRLHGRAYVQPVGLTRGDFPVIFNWLSPPGGDREGNGPLA